MIKSLPVGLILRLNVFSLFHDSTHQTGCSNGHRYFAEKTTSRRIRPIGNDRFAGDEMVTQTNPRCSSASLTQFILVQSFNQCHTHTHTHTDCLSQTFMSRPAVLIDLTNVAFHSESASASSSSSSSYSRTESSSSSAAV
jgi:hypothetical protein